MTALPPGWLTIGDAMRYFGVSRSTITRRITTGDWPTTVLPGMRSPKFSPADVEAIEAAATARKVSA